MSDKHARPRVLATIRRARSRDQLWTLAMLLLLLGFTAVVLGPALLGRGTLLDVGLMRGMWPFSAYAGPGDAIPCRGDTIDYYMPGVANIRDAAYSGNLLTWSPYEVGGAPLASLPNHAVLSPLSWPYFALPLWLAPAFVKLGELVVVVAGMTLLLGRFGVRRSAGILAGLVFFTSGFMIMWTNWPHTKVAAFIPLLFWALDRVVTNRRPIDTVLVAVVVASMLLGGFPAVTMFALTFGALYVVARGIAQAREHGGRALVTGWAGAGGGVALGLGLAAVQILPFVRNISTLGYEERVVSGAKPLGYLMTAIAPESLGACRGFANFGGPSNPIESTAFLGAGALVLALLALVTLRRDGAAPTLVVAALFGLATVLLWVGGPVLSFVQSLPGYDHNSIGRLTSVFGFLAAVLAGFGFDRLLRRSEGDPAEPDGPRPGRARIVLASAVVGTVVLLFALAFHEARGWAAESGNSDLFLRRTSVGVALVVLATAAVVLTWFLRRRVRDVAALVLVLVVVAESTYFAHALLPLSEREDFYPVTPTHQFLQEHIGHDRYAGDRSWGYPATSDYYRLRTPVGHEFTDPDWKAILRRIDPHVQASPTYSAFSGSVDTAAIGQEPLLDQLSVRYWVASPGNIVGKPSAWPRKRIPGRTRIDDGARASCAIPSAPLRGMQFRLARRFVPARRVRTVLHVRVTTPEGVLESEQTLVSPMPRGRTLRIGVMGEHLSSKGQARAEVWVTGTRRRMVLTGSRESLHCSPVVPPAADDGLELVHTDRGAVVYERTTSLPRIRWAGRSQVVPDAEERLALLVAGIPDDTVLLDEGTSVTGPSRATVDVVEDDAETIRVDVDSDGPGHVVLADSIAREGWTATLDGREVPIHGANHALAAVAVDEGRHTLVLEYDAPGLRAGRYVSAGSLLVVLLLCAWHVLARRNRAGGSREGAPGVREAPSGTAGA